MKKFAVILSVLMGLGLFGFVMSPYHESYAESSTSYSIPLPFETVKKSLVRGDVLAESMYLQNGKVLKKNVKSIRLSSEKLLKGWEADIVSEFTIEVPNPVAGTLQFDLVQEVKATKDSIEGKLYLQREANCVRLLNNDVSFRRNGDSTQVDFKARLIYGRRIPFFLKGYMDGKVKESADKVCINGPIAISRVIEKTGNNPGKRFNIRINGKGQ